MIRLLLLILLLAACKPPAKTEAEAAAKEISTKAINCQQVEIWSAAREKLTVEYAREHYNIADYKLDSPAMVVVHYTVIPTLAETLEYFRPAVLDPARTNIAKFSNLNVGVHFVVDSEGSIFCLLPENVMGRHLIGFNHLALGIENVAAGPEDLTPEQLQANVDIVQYLAEKYNSIKYLIGHHEYDRMDLPHYQLIVANNPEYQPYPKYDPGDEFMRQLRALLAEQEIRLLP